MESAAYTEGREAYGDDKDVGDNPYSAGTVECADWDRGWRYAERNDPLAPHNLED